MTLPQAFCLPRHFTSAHPSAGTICTGVAPFWVSYRAADHAVPMSIVKINGLCWSSCPALATPGVKIAVAVDQIDHMLDKPDGIEINCTELN